MIADYERSNFSIHQRKWDANTQANIQTILPVGDNAQSQSSSHSKVSDTVILASTVGGLVLVIVTIGFFIIIQQRNQKLKVLKEQQAPEHSIKSREGSQTIIPPIGATISELDGVDTLIMNPELDAGAIYELPANEAVGSELYSPIGKGETSSLRQRELEQKRNALRQAQFSRRHLFLQNQPQFMFGSLAQTVSSPIESPQSPPVQTPQFQAPNWHPSPGEERPPCTPTWSSPPISPMTCKRQCSNPDVLQSRLKKAGGLHESSQFSKFGSI